MQPALDCIVTISVGGGEKGRSRAEDQSVHHSVEAGPHQHLELSSTCTRLCPSHPSQVCPGCFCSHQAPYHGSRETATCKPHPCACAQSPGAVISPRLASRPSTNSFSHPRSVHQYFLKCMCKECCLDKLHTLWIPKLLWKCLYTRCLIQRSSMIHQDPLLPALHHHK